MNKYLHGLHWGLVIIVAASSVAIAKTSLSIWQTSQVNEFISNPADFEHVPDNANAQFSQASYDVEQAKPEEALDRLTQVLNTEDKALEAAAYFNRGNINLRAARELAAGDSARIALVGLAKQDYRTALLIDSNVWDARFNLEIALLMAPEVVSANKAYKKRKGSQSVVVKAVGFRVDLP
ncbi:MAG: MxaK protein [Gammaproteobacteria bacterium]|nr:MAG: MxaK protein [Gammaproteobacteria bacterium]